MTKAPPDRRDSDADCEIALAAEFEALASHAQAAGWREDVITAALLSLSLDHVHSCKAAASAAIAKARE
jgi:hypothetical protein